MSKTYEAASVTKRYDSAREMPRETIDLWVSELRRMLPATEIRMVLDLGCGTGRFSSALQCEFGCPVVGVEPSSEMLNQARRRSPKSVEWKNGSAERIPLADGTVDVVWMSQVFHHLEDTSHAFGEMRRVLRPSGWLAVRNGTREADRKIEWLRCFPEAQSVDAERIPSRQQIVDAAVTVGFQFEQIKTVYQYVAASYAEYYAKISQRGLSSLIVISDESFQAGLRRLRTWVDHQPAHRKVHEPVDLFLFSQREPV